jgi:SOS-response transcriptional repressor LexA
MDATETTATVTTATVRPTKKQQQLLAFIGQFIAEHGYSPSYREIMNGCQYTSVATVALHVGNLIKRGHLRKRDHSARSIEVVSNAAAGGLSADEETKAKGNLGSTQPQPEPSVWLKSKLEAMVASAEALRAAGDINDKIIDDIQIVLAAYDVLGISAVGEPLFERIQALQAEH